VFANHTLAFALQRCQRFTRAAASTDYAEEPNYQSTDRELREAIQAHEPHF
jgi:folate-dependent phosphoribosylglycinamide formyltransferase PurN